MEKFIDVLKSRRSIRTFNDKKIEDNLINEIVEAGLYAPSGMNRQEALIIVVKNEKIINDGLEVIRKVSKDEKYNGFYNSKLVIHISNTITGNNSLADCAVIAQNIMLAASYLNIGSVWVNQFKTYHNEDLVRNYLKELKIDDSHKIYVSIALGYSDKEIHFDRKNRMKVNIID